MTAPSVSALRGPRPPAAGPAAPQALGLRSRQPPGDGPLMPAPAARLLALALLVTFGAHHWMLMLEPAAAGRAWAAVAIAALLGLALRAVAALPDRSRRRTVAAPALVALAVVLSAPAAGADDALLAPAAWDELAAGLMRGAEALPAIQVPYGGLDEWIRLVLALGGILLAVSAAALACWPRAGGRTGRPAAAVLALVTLYAVPAVALSFDGEFLRGAVLAVLVLAFLRLERLRRRDAPAAAAAAAGAAVLALAAAPALDRLDPWWDYESWALDAAGSGITAFNWEHDYAGLRWPRDGRELLRVRSGARAYWKADQLDVFDGRAWVRDGSAEGAQEALGTLTDGVPDRLLDQWTERIRVAVRGLRTETFVTAGSLKDVRLPGEPAWQTPRAGVHRTTRALRRGDAYTALVYVPRPSARQLSAAGTAFAPGLLRYTRLGVRTAGDAAGIDGNPRTTVVDFRGFGAPATEARIDPQAPTEPAGRLLAAGGLERSRRLSRRLLARSATPYEYVERVEAHLARGFEYSETPPPGSDGLDGFLFETRTGYCQQFSGAMALLLRLAGIPARVAVGFSPGSYDEEAGEYVVRDTDAHSWVEVWFPGIGWVTRDPTPSAAPPRSQADEAVRSAAPPAVRDIGTTSRPGVTSLAEADGGPGWPLIAVGAGALLAAAAGLRRLRAAHRRRRAAGPLGELERALRVAGGGLEPGTTLAALERRFAASPAAAGYVRALRSQRFDRAAPGPTPSQRRALRRAVGRTGPLGRLRSWWAVPPHPWG